jgi:hypothetical protein
MSNSLAIAATTATIRNLLLTQVPQHDNDLADLQVTTQPPDVARKGITTSQLNLFLYVTMINGAWRNMDMPRQVRPGENGSPPLALNLHYLITAYGRGDTDNEAVSHRALGGAMSVLHDHPVLGRDEIALALAGNDLGSQFERLRITPITTPLDEMSKLWTALQTQYRLSVGYEVTVILIDSRLPVSSALPVIKRGEAGRGPSAVPGAAPTLTGITAARSQPAARLGEDINISGTQLTTVDASVRFANPNLSNPVVLIPSAGNAPGQLNVHLPSPAEDPNAFARWVPGFYTVSVVVARGGVPPIVSNAVPYMLAAQITVSPNNAATGTFALTVTCAPRLVTGQAVLLLFGNRQIHPDSVATPVDPSQPSSVNFTVRDATAGTYLVRLRVDGIDSIPVVYTGTPPLAGFDPSQQVTVT